MLSSSPKWATRTQIATVVLAAKYASLPAVVLGTTLGMMLANTPVVYFGDRLARTIPLRPIRLTAAASSLLSEQSRC